LIFGTTLKKALQSEFVLTYGYYEMRKSREVISAKAGIQYYFDKFHHIGAGSSPASQKNFGLST